MRKLRTLVVSATVGVLAAAGLVSPVSASPGYLAAYAECGRKGYQFRGYGIYEQIPDGPMRRWIEFGGRVWSSGGDLGNKSNLKFRLQEDYRDVYEHRSPDSMSPGFDYVFRFEQFTAAELPENVLITAIWDKPDWPDPSCTRRTETV